MMSSHSVPSLIDPVSQSKMPLFEGTISSTGLSKPGNMSGFLSKQTLQYSGAYFTYDPRGKDGPGFAPSWSNSKTSLLDGRSPVSHLPGMEGQNHIIYRPDSKTFSAEEGHSHSPSVRHTPGKQGFTYYTRSPGISSPAPATPVAVRKQTAGGVNSSPPSENSVYLAIPKPIYGHNPCCNELGCMLGHRYSVEHGSQRMPNSVYESEWIHPGAHYSHRSPIQRKAQETLLQQRGLQFEPNAERLPLKDMTVEKYHSLSPSRVRTLPAYMEPNYSSYPCTPTHTLLGPLSEQSQRLHTSPKGYPSLYSSHPPTYEHMTSEVYQDRSPMSKYGQLPQHPMFYYPQANLEVESRAVCRDTGGKHREDVIPVIPKLTVSNPREHYLVSQSVHGEIPMVSTETLPNHSFMRAFDYPCYAVPRINLNATQMRPSIKRQHAPPSMHPNGLTASSSSLHVDGPMARPTVSPASIQMNRVFSPLTSLHIDRPSPSPASLNMDRPLDYSHYKALVTCTKQPQGLADSPGAWLSQSPTHNGDQIHKAVPTRKVHHASASSLGTTVCKGSLKRSISHTPIGYTSPSIKIKEENRDLCEMDLIKKRQKMKTENVRVEDTTDSPPMPIIDNVFSLAPYKAYLEASGLLRSGKAPQRTGQSSEPCAIKPEPCIQEKGPNRDGQQPVVCLVPKEICTDTPTEKPVVEILEHKNIKVEKVDPPDTDSSVETPVSLCKMNQDDCKETTVKEEVEETDSFDNEPMLVIKKCDPDELESKPLLAVKDETSDDSKQSELTAEMSAGSSHQGDTHPPREQMVIPHPKSITPPQPPESKLNFQNIPPHCLKLSTYKIVLPDTLCATPVLTPETPPVQPVAEVTPKPELQKPVRQRFFELHHSLCKIVSSSVSVSPEQELRTWLSLELTEPPSPSAKIQKVSSLLGVKAREMWLSEEIKSALHKVLERLKEYIAQKHCPFPHVMRTGAVFIPMLVVKELLFPQVQGGFIDQVLQEHRVELRPTTLSEEKIITQLHKRACSSKLRRLLSLKRLPDIYADVVNLFYHACVCKRLGLEMDESAKRETDEGCEETGNSRSPIFSAISASAASGSDPQRPLKDKQTKTHLIKNGTKGRVKSSSRRLFLENTLSDEEEVEYTEKAGNGGVVNTLAEKDCGHPSKGTENGGSDRMAVEEDSSLIPQKEESEDSWTCPLTPDELSSPPSDTETEGASIPLQPLTKSQVRSKNCSGVILKLRRVLFSEGLNRRKARYQAVSDLGTISDPSLSQAEDGEGEETGERSSERDLHRRMTSKVTHRWQRTGGFSHALRPLTSSSKRRHRSLMKIKYCPYLSACHSAEHRRRWVLRSAVQRAQRAMKFYYPDLVGKRIRHLYEEDDKSEVWYRGEVVRIHEAHPNPLKTIFEVRYDSEPEWKYYLELLIDYKKGWLKIED
ncbi:uncharacterized protein C15orf39 homolog [Centroberyx affinis]|uniref:uncharacterized protein C15orf39 homolog n=1 Tax=Centroberyx affinis TaxID=166261 RepID=UPI003A5BC942